jgi:PKD repeat protein
MPVRPHLKIAFLCILACAVILPSCRRNSSPGPASQPEIKNFDFSYSSCLVDNYSIKFKSTLSDSLNHLWDFGDGYTSLATAPEHSYSAPGNYIVSLTINGHVSSTISKKIIVTKNPLYTAMVGGMRLWRHTRHYSDHTGVDTVYSFADTSFAVVIMDPITVIIGTDTMSYVEPQSVGGILYFRKVHYNTSDLVYTTSLSYSTIKDTARYELSSSTSQSWNKVSFVTP